MVSDIVVSDKLRDGGSVEVPSNKTDTLGSSSSSLSSVNVPVYVPAEEGVKSTDICSSVPGPISNELAWVLENPSPPIDQPVTCKTSVPTLDTCMSRVSVLSAYTLP